MEMAKYVNNTHFHYSGNCALLSACLHYDIHHRQNILSSKNTTSLTVGLSGNIVDVVIFGQKLKQSRCFHSVYEVEEEILKRNCSNNEYLFIISAENYIVPIVGECGHDFNAVVIYEDNKASYVQFIDSWKTNNILPSTRELKKHFSSSALFYIRSLGEVYC